MQEDSPTLVTSEGPCSFDNPVAQTTVSPLIHTTAYAFTQTPAGVNSSTENDSAAVLCYIEELIWFL